jgi:hypothetical protein
MKKQVKIIVNLVEWYIIPTVDKEPFDVYKKVYSFLCFKIHITKNRKYGTT